MQSSAVMLPSLRPSLQLLSHEPVELDDIQLWLLSGLSVWEARETRFGSQHGRRAHPTDSGPVFGGIAGKHTTKVLFRFFGWACLNAASNTTQSHFDLSCCTLGLWGAQGHPWSRMTDEAEDLGRGKSRNRESTTHDGTHRREHIRPGLDLPSHSLELKQPCSSTDTEPARSAS